MLWFYRFISGFLELEISGDTTEQFLNLCARSGYIVWHVRRMKERLYCHILVRDFKRLRKRMRKSGARVHITAKVGLPFWTARYHRRWGIPVGAVLFFVILKLLSGFIWSIEVQGNLTVPTEEILDACRKTGVFEGAYAGGIDYKIAGQQLLLEMPDLAWAAINLEGCQVTVNVSETKTPIREETRPCNIKAKADGIITKIDVQRGDCVVKVGDTVSRGDLLISGLVEKGGVITPVRAAGTITATTTREVTFSAPYRRTNRIRTGKKKTRRVLQAFGVSAPLYLGRVKGLYEAEYREKTWRLFGKNMPVHLHEKVFWMMRIEERILSREELENELIEQSEAYLQLEKIPQYEVKNREFDEIQDGLRLKSLVLGREEIGMEEILLFSTGNH